MWKRQFTPESLNAAIAAYQAGTTTTRTAKADFGVSSNALLRHLRLRGIAVRAPGLTGYKRGAHPTWKGGRHITDEGYVRVYAPDHPWPRRSKYIYEHVLIMELELGRRLLASESVHHLDHDRANNARSNLELTTRSAHSRHHRLLDTHKRKRDARGNFA
jgi:hypothetical protein